MVNARVEGQEREAITIGKTTYHTIRYEAFLFDNVLYQRKGRLWIWMTDDGARAPCSFGSVWGFPSATSRCCSTRTSISRAGRFDCVEFG